MQEINLLLWYYQKNFETLKFCRPEPQVRMRIKRWFYGHVAQFWKFWKRLIGQIPCK
jgi:hypothetical protein